MSTWTYDTPPDSNSEKTKYGWSEKGNPKNVIIPIANLHLKSDSGGDAKADILGVEFGETSYSQGDDLSVTVKFSERVDVTVGANIVISHTRGAGDVTLYAAAQTAVSDVVFNKQSDNTTQEVVPADVAASGTLTFTDQPEDTETVTIGSTVYTFQATLTDVDGNVLIGATLADSIANLIAHINGATGAGTTYAASGTAHADVDAVDGGSDDIDVTAKVAGTAGNSIDSTTTVADASWGAATLTGGVDNTGTMSIGTQTITGTIVDADDDVKAVGTLTFTDQPEDGETVVIDSKTYTYKTTLGDVNGHVLIGGDLTESIRNLVYAINGGGNLHGRTTDLYGDGSGVLFADETTAHTSVDATIGADSVVVTAKTAGTAGNSITTTTTVADASWGGATLASGAVQASNKTISAGQGTDAGTRVIS